MEAESATPPVADTAVDQAQPAFTPEEAPVIEAGLEPRTEDLPLADDPVLPEEIDTAGGPSADTADAPEFQAETGETTEEEHALLPPTEQIGDIGVIPLSLLEAEAEAAEVEESAVPPLSRSLSSGLPKARPGGDISPTRGRSDGDRRNAR